MSQWLAPWLERARMVHTTREEIKQESGTPEIKHESGKYVDYSIKFPPPVAGIVRKRASAPAGSPADVQDLQHLGFKFMRIEAPRAECADTREGRAKRMVFHYTLRTVDKDGRRSRTKTWTLLGPTSSSQEAASVHHRVWGSAALSPAVGSIPKREEPPPGKQAHPELSQGPSVNLLAMAQTLRAIEDADAGAAKGGGGGGGGSVFHLSDWALSGIIAHLTGTR